MCQVVGVGVHLDVDTVEQVTPRSIEQHMAVGNHVQPFVPSTENPVATVRACVPKDVETWAVVRRHGQTKIASEAQEIGH